MSTKLASYAQSLTAIEKKKTFRKRKPMTPINGAFIIFEDQKLLSFCTHDYLGLADNPDMKKNAIKYLLEHGICASSESKDLYLNCQQKLENTLSNMLGRQSALFFPSRYEANIAALSTLGHEEACFFIDDACHPSLIKGAEMSMAKVVLYPHSRHDQLERQLDESSASTKIVVSESVFSLTGNVCNLPILIELSEHFDTLLYVDDSHAFGVAGVEGMGLCAHLQEVDIIAGSFSKACGAYGGYICSSEIIRDYLVNLSPLLTTYLFPPPIIGAIEAAFKMIPQMEGERKQLQQRSHWLREALRECGFDLPRANTPLISLSFSNPDEIESLRTFLKTNHILVGPKRIFEGEKTTSRLNIALNVCHMPDHTTRLIEAIREWEAL